MTSSRNLSDSPCCRWIAVIAVVVTMMTLGRDGSTRATADDSPSAPPAKKELIDKAELELKKMSRAFFRKLGRLKPVDATKKTLDDYYVTCTVELDTQTRTADIRFEMRQGQQVVADFLADFVLNRPKRKMRAWHVIGRFSDGTKAEAATQAVRKQYDQMVAYRTELQKQYRAKKTVRC